MARLKYSTRKRKRTKEYREKRANIEKEHRKKYPLDGIGRPKNFRLIEPEERKTNEL